MKRILSLAAVASLALAANAEKSPYQDKNYADWGKLKLVGNQLSDKDGNPVQLKGWSTFSLHYGEVQGCLGAGQWKLMQQYGANIVRLAMYIDESGSYLSNPTLFKEMVKESIAETKALNMYCMIDWHVLETNGHSGNPNDHLSEAKDFFSEISKYCADNGYDHVLYELCNEPTCGWDNIKRYAEALIPSITNNQKEAIIVVGTDQWCQKIKDPVSNPISREYKDNVMYSFHYYSCSHYSLLGDFRNAQSNIPVFVSEWSAVYFNGDGPFCASNGDQLIAACEVRPEAPQLVSWCIWNWGKKDEASSFFKGTCASGNESSYTDGSGKKYGDYVRELMAGELRDIPEVEVGPWTTLNQIPTKVSALWHWDYYDIGGEGISYHDGNGGAWEKVKEGEKKGTVTDYANAGEEVDVFSLAQEMQWLDKPCPWSTVENGKVVSWESVINTTWTDSKEKKPTYKSLNGGRCYSGTDGSARPDEGVDLSNAGCQGTDYEWKGYCNLGWVEEDEWINFTVNVAKPGYYKIGGVINAEYGGSKEGEIAITSSHGNHLRATYELSSPEEITTFGFPKTQTCADASKSDPWDCWAVSDAKSGDETEVLCAFGKAGEQQITITFSGNAGGVGPLTFTWYGELDPNDPITGVSNIDANEVEFSIFPNPTSGEFTVALADDAEATVEVVNVAGQVVASQKVEGSATIKKALAAGVYTVVVKSNGAVSAKKLVVK
ncbi:MAG: T9SS type A sorting domain-containing protein [Bacteroidales bacterium]|jgi:endoglucanase|nr:T9SS type A sorting domain-containing protein [Bacteroidales bacterium]